MSATQMRPALPASWVVTLKSTGKLSLLKIDGTESRLVPRRTGGMPIATTRP